jgi:exoribonuclease II
VSETPARPDIAPGSVAFLADGGSLVAVRVDSASDGKLLTRSVDGKERRVSPRRLLWTSAETVDDLAGLAAHWRRTSREAEGWDAEGAWTHLAEQGHLRPARADEVRARLPESLQPPTDDALIVAVFEDPLHFRMRAGEVHPTSAEAIELARAEAQEAMRRAEALQRAVTAFKATLAGEPVDGSLQADFERHVASLETVALQGQEADALALGQVRKLLDALDLSGQGDPRYLAFEALRQLKVFHEDENLAMRREEIPHAFLPEVEAAAAAASESWSRADRADLTSLYTVAIDSAHTTEVDDAFAIDGNRLVVFIADASAFAPIGGAVDIEARRRISTLYLPECMIPMLPPSLGQGSASLSPDQDRPALAMSFRLDPSGEIVDFQLEEAICRLDARLPYSHTDALLRGESGDDPRSGALVRSAQRMMSSHRRWRMNRGALQLQRSEVNIEVSPDGSVEVKPVEANGAGRQLISEMMVATCAGVATWCVARDVPSIYRCQASPADGDGHPQGEVTDPAEQAAVLRRLQPTALMTEPGLHYTLALDAYVQVSSPLRRYSDLVMHRQLKASLRGEAPPYDAEALRALCQTVERRTGAVRRVEYETRRYWTLKYLAQNPAKVFTAFCVRPMRHRWLVALDELAQRALIRTRRRLQPGVALAVTVDTVNARRNKVVMKEAE